VGYRSWRHRACYITRMDKDNIPGLDAVTATFRRREVSRGAAGLAVGVCCRGAEHGSPPHPLSCRMR